MSLNEYMELQREEMQKYIWCLGVEIGHDPREDKTENELCIEWHNKYGIKFRNEHPRNDLIKA